MKSSPQELHFLEMTAPQMLNPFSQQRITEREYLFSCTVITTAFLVFDSLVGKNVYFSIPPPK